MAKAPTMDDVAREAGVSRALVSLVMRDAPNVSDARREAVVKAAERLGYRPNLHARNLAQRRSGSLGVLINDLHNPFFSDVMDGVEAEADHHGLRVLILNGGRDPDREWQAIETYLQFQVEALILIGSRLDDENLLEAAANVPVAIVAAGWNHAGIDTITTDDEKGAALAVDHLVELGHERIVHLDGAANISSEPRRAGYVHAMQRHGLDPVVVIAGDNEDDAARAIDRLFEHGDLPTAIFAFNDLLAAGVLDAVDDRGLSVPDDISLVGYDNTFIASLNHLALTTVNQPRRQMGSMAVTAMSERIAGTRSETVMHQLDPQLVIRRTTSPPSDSGRPST